MKRSLQRTGGYTLVECVAALTLVIVLLPALFPRLDAELSHLGDLYEREAARLIVEAELARAADEASSGPLARGTGRRPSDGYPSARRLPDLVLLRTVSSQEPGLVAVSVRAEWRSRSATAQGPRRKVVLTTWIAGS